MMMVLSPIIKNYGPRRWESKRPHEGVGTKAMEGDGDGESRRGTKRGNGGREWRRWWKGRMEGEGER